MRKPYADSGTGRPQYRNIVWTINDVLSDGDRVVISGNWAGEFWACPFSVDFMTFWRLEDGLIAEQRDFFAASAFDRQVAWDPAAGRATCGKEAARPAETTRFLGRTRWPLAPLKPPRKQTVAREQRRSSKTRATGRFCCAAT